MLYQILFISYKTVGYMFYYDASSADGARITMFHFDVNNEPLRYASRTLIDIKTIKSCASVLYRE